MLIDYISKFIRLSEQAAEVNLVENYSRTALKDTTSLTIESSTNGMNYNTIIQSNTLNIFKA